MRLELNLYGGLEDQPSWWKNFVDVLYADYNYRDIETSDAADILVDEKFLEWGGRPIREYTVYTDNEDYVAIEFENEADATWFLLRWS